MTVESLAEGLSRTSPLGPYADRFAAAPVDLAEEPYVPMLLLRTGDPTGLPAANRATFDGTRTTIWLGPDEWLITGPDATATTGRATDVSAQRTTIRLRGPYARALLAKGCSVDLHPRVAPAGTAVQTAVARTGVILVVVENGPDLDVRLLVRSSFASYLAEWLLDAAVEYG